MSALETRPWLPAEAATRIDQIDRALAGADADRLETRLLDLAEANRAIPVITRVMEEAPLPLLQLKVPLKVDARAAKNWDEAH